MIGINPDGDIFHFVCLFSLSLESKVRTYICMFSQHYNSAVLEHMHIHYVFIIYRHTHALSDCGSPPVSVGESVPRPSGERASC